MDCPDVGKVPWTNFRFFNGKVSQETYNAMHDTDFQRFDGRYYLYGPLSGDQRFGFLAGDGIYREGHYNGPDFIWAIMIAAQKEGETKAVERMMFQGVLLGSTEEIGSKDDNPVPNTLILDMIPFYSNPGIGILNSGGRFSTLDKLKRSDEVAHHMPPKCL